MEIVRDYWYLPFAFIPSLLWLSYYLRKDVHPEPNHLILRVFFWGMLSAPVAAVIEMVVLDVTHILPITETARNVVFVFGGIALVEEYVKYFVVRSRILRDPAFDEPTDAMIYLIISALGFAATENIFAAGNEHTAAIAAAGSSVGAVAGLLTMRFITATFFQALASAIVGYFVAKAILRQVNRYGGIFFGLALAALLHGIYDYAILHGEADNLSLSLFIFLLLAVMALGVGAAFRRLRRICFLLLPMRIARQHALPTSISR